MISRFNLLPHRAKKQLWGRRVLVRQIGLVLMLAFLAASAIYGGIVARLNYLEAYNRGLQSAVEKILPEFRASQQFQKQRDEMLERQKVLERLDARRSTSVMILDDVSRALPSEAYLTRLEEDGDKFRLEGKALNNGAIAKLFESLVRSERLSGLALEEIRLQEGESLAPYAFLIVGNVKLSVMGDNAMTDRARE